MQFSTSIGKEYCRYAKKLILLSCFDNSKNVTADITLDKALPHQEDWSLFNHAKK